jgi:beta-lactamase class A
MKNNTTSYKRMRAGVPIGWVVADKTGSGSQNAHAKHGAWQIMSSLEGCQL